MTQQNYPAKVNSIQYLQYLISKPKVETEQKSFIKQILQVSHNNCSMTILVENAGMSKTTAVAEYFFENGKCNYIKAGEFHRSITLFHELVFYLTGESVDEFTPGRTIVKHVSSLLTSDKAVKKMVVIDDADKLSPDGLELFSDLRDATNDCTSIVFIGRPRFLQNLNYWKEEKKGVGEFYKKVEQWFYQVPDLRSSEKIAYSQLRGVTSVEELTETLRFRSMSELENFVNMRLQHRARWLFGL